MGGIHDTQYHPPPSPHTNVFVTVFHVMPCHHDSHRPELLNKLPDALGRPTQTHCSDEQKRSTMC